MAKRSYVQKKYFHLLPRILELYKTMPMYKVAAEMNLGYDRVRDLIIKSGNKKPKRVRMKKVELPKFMQVEEEPKNVERAPAQYTNIRSSYGIYDEMRYAQ